MLKIPLGGDDRFTCLWQENDPSDRLNPYLLGLQFLPELTGA